MKGGGSLKQISSVEAVIRRYKRRVKARNIAFKALFPSFFFLLGYVYLVNRQLSVFVELSRHVLSVGWAGVLLALLFFMFIAVGFYSISCPICKTTFFAGRKRSGGKWNEVKGYCPTCQTRFEIDKFLAEHSNRAAR